MVFFAFSFLASLFGGISAGRGLNLSFNIPLSVDGPLAGILSFWPFIVALVLLLLTILWYQNIKNLRRRRSESGVQVRPGTQGMVLMGIVTVFVIILLAAPWYLHNLENNDQAVEMAEGNRSELVLTVHGMDCGGCESLVQRTVGALEGVESVAASHTREEVYVVYDKSKLSQNRIAQAVEESGYTVVLE